MPTPHPRPLWHRLFRSPQAVVEDDAADMGTAIGLDFVLDQQPQAALDAAPARRAPAEPSGLPRYFD